MHPAHSFLPIFYDLRLFLLGLLHSILPSLALSTSHIVLTQSCLYELNGRKGLPIKQAFTNRWVLASFSGMVLAQVFIMLSIYSPPLYTVWLRPHFWSLVLSPYMFTYCYRSLDSSLPVSNEQYRYHHPDEARNLFLESFFGQLINPIIWPTPVLSRVMTSFLFRYSQASMFLAGTIIGCIGGHFLLVFMACLLVYLLEKYTPTSAKAFNILFYRFFQYTTIVLTISCASIAPIAMVPKSLPLVEINTMSLRDPWPNIFFDSVIWHRPFWFPKVFGLEEKTNLAEERELKIKQLRKEALRQLQQEDNRTRNKIQEEKKVEKKVEKKANKRNKKRKKEDKKVIDPSTAFLNYKRFSQFFFGECINAGRRRLIYNYPESLAVCHENIEIALDFPFLSEESEDKLYEEWIEEKTNRRDILYNSIVTRMAAINGLKNTFEKVAETKLVSSSSPVKMTAKEKNTKSGELYVHLDPRLRSIVPGRFDQLKHLNWNVSPIQKVDKQDKLAVDQSNLRKTIPSGDGHLLIGEQVNVDNKPSLSLSIKEENRLKHWIILQSQELEYNLIIPWFVLSDRCRLAMPSVLNNQNPENIAYDAHDSNLSWDTFVDLYELPLPPLYPAELWLGTWGVYLDGLKSLYNLTYQAVRERLKLSENLSKEAKIVYDLQNLQKAFPFFNMTGGEDCKQMINKQLPDPDVQSGRLPFGNNFNSDLAVRNMIPRRRKSQVVKWFRQKTFLSPIFVTFWQKSASKNQNQDNYNSAKITPRYNKDLSTKGVYGGVKNLIGELRITKTPDEVQPFGEIVNRFRGPLLLAQAYWRRYLKLPLVIYTKHTVRMLCRQKSELVADLTDLAREEYRFLPYSGYDKKEEAQEEEGEEEEEGEAGEAGEAGEEERKAGEEEQEGQIVDGIPVNLTNQEDISEIETTLQRNLRLLKTQLKTEFPEAWWADGIQVKIIDPFRVQPWRANTETVSSQINKLQEEVNNLADIEKVPNIIGRDKLVQSTFLTVTGDELDFPGGLSISKPNFIRPIKRAFIFATRVHIRKLLARMQKLPLSKKIIGGLYNRLSQIYQKFVFSPIKRFQVLIQSAYQFFIEKKKQVIASKDKMPFVKVKSSQIAPTSSERKKVRQLQRKKTKTRLSKREMVKYPSLNQYLYNNKAMSDWRFIEFTIFEPLPVSGIKSMPVERQMKLKVTYKLLQLKFLWTQVRKIIVFTKQSIWNLITIDSPLWIKFQIKLLPTNLALVYRRGIEWLDSMEDTAVNSLYNLYEKYLFWRFGMPQEKSIMDNIYLTKAYILQKLWNSKFVINPHINTILDHWNDQLRMRSGVELLLKDEGILSEHSIHRAQWDKWLRHMPHFAPPKPVWSLFKLPYWKKSGQLIKQSKSMPIDLNLTTCDHSLSHLHKKWIRSATNWTKRNKWYQLARSYISEYTGLRVPKIRLRGRPIQDIGPYIKSYDCRPKHLSTSANKNQNEGEVSNENYIYVDPVTEKYFLFDPNMLTPVETYTIAPELTEIKKYYGYWKDSDEKMICEFLENLNRTFLERKQAEEEAQQKGEVIVPETLTQDEFAKLSLGFELLYGENYLRRMHDPEDLSTELGRWVLDFHVHHMREPIFIYNFIAPLFEFTISNTRKESYLQKHIAWLLDESDKLRICRAYDYIMLIDTQREFRVLNLLNITQPLPQSKEKLLAFRSLSGNPEQDVLDRFLWPTHRLEDLACMNRFWFNIGNQSKFSALRVRMYPLVKP